MLTYLARLTLLICTHSSLHDLAAAGDAAGIRALKPSISELDALDEYVRIWICQCSSVSDTIPNLGQGFAPLHLAADKGEQNVA